VSETSSRENARDEAVTRMSTEKLGSIRRFFRPPLCRKTRIAEMWGPIWDCCGGGSMLRHSLRSGAAGMKPDPAQSWSFGDNAVF